MPKRILDNIHYKDFREGLAKVPSKSVDMILCDLPYGKTKNTWDVRIPFDELWEHYNRVIKDDGCIALFCDGMFMAELMVSNKKHWRYNLIWDKVLTSGFLNANKMPLRQHEEVAIFYKNPPTYNPQMTEGKPNHSRGKGGTTKTNTYGSVTIKGADLGNLKHPTSIIRFQKPSSRMAQHPTEKSVEFCEWLIKTYTNKGDTVLDTCAGVGTTVVACVNIERHFIAFENYEKYYYIASRKLNKLRR